MKLATLTFFLVALLFLGCAVESKDTPVEVFRVKNFLFNSNFTIWQRGKTFDVENNQGIYGADRWYLKNTLGEKGQINFSRGPPTLVGSNFGAKIEITQASDTNSQDGCELSQTLDNATTALLLKEQPVSFSTQVRALGNTRKVGVQFVFNETENVAIRPVGQEAFFDINTSRFTRVELTNQSLELVPATGVVGIRIRLLGHATGDGFVIEQAALNPGIYAAPYSNRFPSIDADELSCQRFYEKSFRRDRDPLPLSEAVRAAVILGSTPKVPMNFKPKRIAPKRIIFFDESHIKTDRPVAQEITDRSCVIRLQQARDLEWVIDAEIYEGASGK